MQLQRTRKKDDNNMRLATSEVVGYFGYLGCNLKYMYYV